MRLQQPGPQFCDRRIWASVHLFLDRGELAGQFARHMTTLRPGRGLARVAAAAEDFGDIGNTDKERFRDPSHGQARV